MGALAAYSRFAKEQWGITENEWLLSRHAFSFGAYHNLSRLNFGTLRVFNDDMVQPHQGFGVHRHDNMEIITIVVSGTLEHTDSTGHKYDLQPGDVQRMSAGTGIEHAEINPADEPVHFYQIWIYPKERDITPSYEKRHIEQVNIQNALFCLATGQENKPEDALYLHQDASLYMGILEKGVEIPYTVERKNRGIFVFVMDGQIEWEKEALFPGDCAQMVGAQTVLLKALEPSKLLLIEVGVNTL